MRRSTRHYLVALTVVAAGVKLWRPVRRVEVVGDSMLPALAPGDRLLVVRPARARVGDLVAVVDPRTPARSLVKRVAARGPKGVTVLGDNPAASTDSRTLGPVADRALRGRAVYRYFPDDRRGLL
ncbi:MAG TPA: nickel-type superoxide dismutase maturation protease [Acidimicrobiales bacterium]|nr:nickel-type superoxide dismutase maturation protease [Acidimicrobiales bacterium]